MAKTMRMLIGYASRFGSTREIAIRIADAVRARGSDVDVCSVDEISDFDHYDAVVFDPDHGGTMSPGPDIERSAPGPDVDGFSQR